MGLWDWLKGLLFPPLQRDVSRLEVPGNIVDAVLETVDLSGKPLEEHHRRRGLRDPRLLPKKLPFVRLWKRPPWISFEESKRLFAATMRTRDRRLRDLLPDEEQLRRLGLPVWKTEQELAEALGIPVGRLRSYSIHRERELVVNYVTFAVPKRNGEPRLIMAPKKRLKELLRKLNGLLVDRLPVSDKAHGFRKGRSVATNAQAHVGKGFVIKMDIRQFFPTLHFGRVRGFLVAMGYGYPVATALAVMMTEAERQPVQIEERVYHVPVTSRYCVQGAPTSPGLANAIFLKADRRLDKLAQKLGFAYTRYADDLTFSGQDAQGMAALLRLVPRILAEEGFELNPDKTRVMRACGRQKVAGVTVNRVAGLSRVERRNLRAMIHQATRAPAPAGDSTTPGPGQAPPAPEGGTTTREAKPPGRRDRSRLSRLRGKLAWVRMLNPAQADALQRRLDQPSPAKK